jgi:hypothetical protein
MDLTLDSLLPTCTKCGGEGKLEHPDVSKSQGSFGSRHMVGATPIDCDACQGHGVIPSETGKQLIAFIERARAKGLLSR